MFSVRRNEGYKGEFKEECRRTTGFTCEKECYVRDYAFLKSSLTTKFLCVLGRYFFISQLSVFSRLFLRFVMFVRACAKGVDSKP